MRDLVKMKNILSYPIGTVFDGKTIKEWITYNLEHETFHTKQARQMKRFLSIDDDGDYMYIRGTYEGSTGKHLFMKVNKQPKDYTEDKGKKYDKKRIARRS